MRALYLAVVLVVLVPATATAQQIEDFTIDSLSGETFSMHDQESTRAFIITFFTTFCRPCTQEHPHLERMYKQFREDGLLVLAVSADEPGNKSKVRQWVRRYRLTFPVLLDTSSELTRRYNPDMTFPLTMLVDGNRTIRSVYQGYTPGDEKTIERDLKNLLNIKE
jgi:peroxiredoxin